MNENDRDDLRDSTSTAPSLELAGKRAVVTGASSGIGRAIAIELASTGANVFLHARKNESGLDRTASDVRKFGGLVHSRLADFSRLDECDAFVDACWDTWGQVDIWINNAGADVLTGEIARESFAKKLERLWQVDVRATMHLARAAGVRMKASGGVILNMGWDQAAVGQAGESGEMFAASKGAVMAFSRSLARSLAPRVRVNCLAPGWILTKWGESVSETWDARARGESLAGRWGTPEEVARVARFLVSPESSFINGQIIPINGGSQPWPSQLT